MKRTIEVIECDLCEARRAKPAIAWVQLRFDTGVRELDLCNIHLRNLTSRSRPQRKDDVPTAIEVDDAELLIECPYCDRLFPKQQSMSMHVVRSHPDKPSTKQLREQAKV